MFMKCLNDESLLEAPGKRMTFVVYETP